jgi:hypothetical protein
MNAPKLRRTAQGSARRPTWVWRLMTTGLLVIALTVGLGLTAFKPATATIEARPAAVVGPQVVKWMVDYLLKKVGKATTKQILESTGFKCTATIICYREGNFDPPRWYYKAVVQTGLGASGYLRARGLPNTNAPIVRTFPEGWKLTIFCQTTGPTVYGRWGPTNVWNYVGRYNGEPMFVSDGFVYTGTNNFVAGDCGATNFGDG